MPRSAATCNAACTAPAPAGTPRPLGAHPLASRSHTHPPPVSAPLSRSTRRTMVLTHGEGYAAVFKDAFPYVNLSLINA